MPQQSHGAAEPVLTDAMAPDMPAFPMARTCPFTPPAEYAQLRERGPVTRAVLPTGEPVWLVTGHAHARQLLADPRVSKNPTHPAFPVLAPIPMHLRKRMAAQMGASLVGMDPPEHTVLRRRVTNEFTVKRVEAMRPRIQEIVDGCIDRILTLPRPVDLVQELSLPVSSLVICELLGVPYSDHEFFQDRTRILVDFESAPEKISGANVDLAAYMDKLVTGKEQNPSHDLLSRLVIRWQEEGDYDHGAAVAMARLLLFAGHDTTAHMISLGTIGLLENPDQLADLRRNPDLAAQAAEELLRYFSIADLVPRRVAREDIEVGGVTIRAGEGLIALLGAANRDSNAFTEPDALDIRRRGRQHVAFGYGPHQCLGQTLARAQLEIVFSTLFQRIPGMRLAVPATELPYTDNATVYGCQRVPVTW